MTEQLFADIIFYSAPFVFLGAGFAIGWTINNLVKDRKEKKPTWEELKKRLDELEKDSNKLRDSNWSKEE